MNLEIIVAAGYNTPAKLAGFLALDNEEQTAIYTAAAAKSGRAEWVCDVTKKPGGPQKAAEGKKIAS